MAKDLEEEAEPDELASVELDDSELEGELDGELAEDLDDDLGDGTIEDVTDVTDVEEDVVAVVAAVAPAGSEESEEDDDEDDDEDVEASLDQILKERLVVEAEEDDEEEEVADPDDRSEISEHVLPKQPDEFVCSSCFLVKHPSQLADAARSLCRDCV